MLSVQPNVFQRIDPLQLAAQYLGAYVRTLIRLPGEMDSLRLDNLSMDGPVEGRYEAILSTSGWAGLQVCVAIDRGICRNECVLAYVGAGGRLGK